MNSWFLFYDPLIDNRPSCYFTGYIYSSKFLFKFVLNKQILDGYLTQSGFVYFTDKLNTRIPRGIFTVHNSLTGKWKNRAIYHPNCVYGINCFSNAGNREFQKFMNDNHIELIWYKKNI